MNCSGAACALTVACLWCSFAPATTIDQTPAPTILLPRSNQFIVQDAWNSVALYGCNDGDVIRTFPAKGKINQIETTLDEELLLVACENGELGIWKVSSGKKLWWHKSSQSGLGYIYDASLSADGKSVIACNYHDFAVIFDAMTGKKIGKISFPPMETNIMSATLSPDGSQGAFVTLGEELFTFETATGRMKDTGLKGAWPIRYSADGKYVALRSSNSGREEQLRVIAIKDIAKKDVGEFSHIGHIKPTVDGGFVVCAWRGIRFDEPFTAIGMEYHPGADRLTEVWKLSTPHVGNRTDFDPKQVIGVSTEFRLVTRLIDLRTGVARLTIDNSANYRPTILTYTSLDLPRFNPLFAMVGGIAAMVTLGWLVTLFLRRKRNNSTPD